MWSPWILLALIGVVSVGARILPARSPAPPSKADVLLGVVMGVVFAVLISVWFIKFPLVRGMFTGSDFEQYCENVERIRRGELAGWAMGRNYFAALLPGILARSVGVIHALHYTAIFSVGVIGAALFAWGYAVSGRAAGVAAALLGLGLWPVVVLGRTLSFYPEMAAAATVCAAAAAWMIRTRGRPWVALIFSLLVGGSMLFGPRIFSVIWACTGVGLLGAFWGGWRRGLLTAALLIGSYVASYQIADLAPANVSGLGAQAGMAYNDALRLGLDMQVDFRGNVPHFVWGRDGLPELLTVLEMMGELGETYGAELINAPSLVRERANHVWPLFPLWIGSLVIVLIGYWREPRALAALLLPAFPFVFNLYAMSTTLIMYRGLSISFMFVPVLWAAAIFAVVRRGRPIVAIGALVLVTLVIFGAIPTPLSPMAVWRLPPNSWFPPRTYAEAEATPPMIGERQGDRFVQGGQCVEILLADSDAGYYDVDQNPGPPEGEGPLHQPHIDPSLPKLDF